MIAHLLNAGVTTQPTVKRLFVIIYDIKASEFIDFGVNVGVMVFHQGLSTHHECHKVKINVFDYGHHCPGHV